MTRQVCLAVLIAVLVGVALPRSASAQMTTWEEEQRRSQAEQEAAPRKKAAKKKPARKKVEVVEDMDPPDDTTGPLGALTAGGGVCGALALNGLGSSVVAAVVSGVALLPGVFCISTCAPVLGCAPMASGAAGSCIFLLSGIVGTFLAPVVGSAAANFGARRRIPLAPMALAIAAPTILGFLLGVVVEAPLIMAGMYAGLMLGFNLYYLQNPHECTTTGCSRSTLQRSSYQFAAMFAVLLGAAFFAPAVGILLGNVVGGGLSALVAGFAGRGMRGEESGYYFDPFSVPDLTDEERAERNPRSKKKKKKPAKALEEDDSEETIKRPAKPAAPPEEEEYPALAPEEPEDGPEAPLLPSDGMVPGKNSKQDQPPLY